MPQLPLPGSILPNGATVVDSRPAFPDYPADSERGREFVVLAVREDSACPFVTWRGTNRDGSVSTYWGHYCPTLAEAVEDFTDR